MKAPRDATHFKEIDGVPIWTSIVSSYHSRGYFAETHRIWFDSALGYDKIPMTFDTAKGHKLPTPIKGSKYE